MDKLLRCNHFLLFLQDLTFLVKSPNQKNNPRTRIEPPQFVCVVCVHIFIIKVLFPLDP